jgi:hypothetical protein
MIMQSGNGEWGMNIGVWRITPFSRREMLCRARGICMVFGIHHDAATQ